MEWGTVFSVRLCRTGLHLWPLRHQWLPAGASRRHSPCGPGRGAEHPGSGPAAFRNNSLWTSGPLLTVPAVTCALSIANGLAPCAFSLFSCLTHRSRPIGRPAQGRRVLSVAFPEASEVSGKAIGLPSYAPVARHRKSWRCPFVRNTAPCLSEPEAPG